MLIASETDIDSIEGLPATLDQLDVHRTRLRTLHGLPERIRTLDLRETRVTRLDHLPVSLRSLKFSGKQFTRLPELPDSLTYLEIGATGIQRISGLPLSLRTLSLAGGSIEILEDLPVTVQSLALNKTGIRRLPQLPAGLQSLELVENTNLQISALPRFLTRLRIVGGTVPAVKDSSFLSSLHLSQGFPPSALPDSISVLTLDACKSIPAWPPHLRDLALTNFGDLASARSGSQPLRQLPAGLEGLDLSGSTVPLTLLPASLRRLALSVPDLRPISRLLEHVEELDLTGSPLSSLAGLPATGQLRSLVVCDTRLARIDQLPESLERLEICGCPALTSIAKLPPRLVVLNVARTGLRTLPALPPTLRGLDISNTRIDSLAALAGHEGLESLTLSAGEVTTLAGMPRSVRQLNFVDAVPVGPSSQEDPR